MKLRREKLAPQLPQQIQSRMRGHVERRGRLVTDDQLQLHRERTRAALALVTGKLEPVEQSVVSRRPT